jgi:cytochrome b6-f complex iron-sulfur subunit
MADETKPEVPSAPPTGANPAATPQHKPVPGGDEPATAQAAAETGAVPTRPAAAKPAAAKPAPAAAAAAGAHAAKPAAPRPPAAPIPDLAGKTTNAASAGGRAAATAPAKAAAATRDPDDTSPLLTRRAWMGLAWGAFSAATAAALAATGRFMFPNVLNEPPQQFKAGFPNEYGMGVDERWKEKFGIWLVRTPDDLVAHASGFYAIISVCTHLGCTPNYLSAESKFKCPCHGSGFRLTGINFEGPAPRPLERARVVMADDGQLLIDKSRKFQYELGQWTDPEAFLKV